MATREPLLEGIRPQVVEQVLARSGVVTLMFTDIVDSTALKRSVGGDSAYFELVKRPHDALVRECIEATQGHVVNTAGDSFFAAFFSPIHAVKSAVEIQIRLTNSPISAGSTDLQVRIGLHSGEPVAYRNEATGLVDLSGNDVDKAARIEALAFGGQLLISEQTALHCRDSLSLRFRDWGEYLLKGLGRHRVVEVLWGDREPRRPLGSWRMPPSELSTFVGREHDIAQLLDLFPKTRLLTLWGMGGVGKTRLAIEVAKRLADDESLKDGVVLVGLVGARTVDDVLSAIFKELSLTPIPGITERMAVFDCLADRSLLLLLDNCETVAGIPTLLRELLAKCSGLRLLCASQAPVGIPDVETVFPVEPLPIPHDRGQAIEGLDSFKLFAERARLGAGEDRWSFTTRSRRLIAEVLRLTDGIPLAIEIVAAWANERPLEVIRDGLKQNRASYQHRFPAGARESRHVSIWTCLDWSCGLLHPDAQALLARASVFAGTFSPDAARVVCDFAKQEDLLDSLHSLSFLLREPGKHRYLMLPTVREYAAARLGRERRIYLDRAAEYFLQVAEESDAMLRGTEQAAGLDRMAADIDNIRAGMDWAAATRKWPLVAKYARSLVLFLRTRGYWAEALSRLRKGERASHAAGDPRVLAAILNSIGGLLTEQAEYRSARTAYREALRIFGRLHDPIGRATVMNNGVGEIARRQGRNREAIRAYKVALTIFRRFSDKPNRLRQAIVLNNMGEAYRLRGDFVKAGQYYKKSLLIGKELRDSMTVSLALANLGNVARLRGRLLEARVLCKKSLRMTRNMLDAQGEARALSLLGDVSVSQGRYLSALRRYRASTEVFWRLGDRLNVAESVLNMAHLFAAISMLPRAVFLYRAAGLMLRQVKSPHYRDTEKALRRLGGAIGVRQSQQLFHEAETTSWDKIVSWILSGDCNSAVRDALSKSRSPKGIRKSLTVGHRR